VLYVFLINNSLFYRYYFAIAECDSARTANMLYEELDGVEMESSAMVFDLSLVPEDLHFEERECRDSYSASASGMVNANYKPPDFVVNALQHTKVQCSWDDEDALRDRQLSNLSSWRNLNESELQRYVASSSSESEGSDSDNADESDDDSENHDARLKRKKSGTSKSDSKQQKAANMRKLLLGENNSDYSSDEGKHRKDDFFNDDSPSASEDEDNESEDDADEGSDKDSMYADRDLDGEDGDFFKHSEDEDEDEKPKKSNGKAGKAQSNGDQGKTLTYIPELGKQLLDKKRGVSSDETPYEAEQRKAAEKKKARKAAKKEFQAAAEAAKKAAAEQSKDKKGKKGKKNTAPVSLDGEEDKRQKAALDLLFNSEMDENQKDDYDMHELVMKEKNREKSKSKKNKRKHNAVDGDANDADDDFKVDVSDARFSKLFEGDARFGIDTTSSEFKPTPSTKTILSEQVKRRKGADQEAEVSSKPAKSSSSIEKDSVDSLVNKLKNKYSRV
jgi:hypothetical protein